MDQLIKMVQERANIDEGQAQTAVDTVVGFLKDRLPDPIAGQIDSVLSGSGDSGSPMEKVGGILGR
jgi:hypothetical protein